MAALARAEGSLSQGQGDTARHHQWCLRAEFIMCEGENQGARELPGEDAEEDQEAQPRVWGSSNTVPQLRAYLSTLISEHPKATIRPALARLLAMWRALLSAEMYSAYSERPRTGPGQDGDALDSESDLGSAAGTVISERLSSSWETGRADEERQRGVGGQANRTRPEALKTMETVVEHLESLMNSKLYRSDHDLLHLYAAALLYLADLLAQARPGSQIKHADAKSREKAIRDRARAVLGHIVQQGGQIDHRLRYVIDASAKRAGRTVE
ncbi:uncharacterized protein DNG_08489 [Cephalotrichum gorgonifer]|uniref:Uncharacterized protein n=1 Tax=Cephalotrichum gorgonifer TaxID=2041049 RepID=A0AAE8N6K0_9PEZI|nr:uncharacterized protein DNG_08489 [Cephalotrichum gorgonifer]